MNKLQEYLTEKYKKKCEEYLRDEELKLEKETELSKKNMDGIEFFKEEDIDLDDRASYEIMMLHVGSVDYPALDSSTKEMRSDERFVLKAIINWQDNFQYAAPHLRNDVNLITYASICPRYEYNFRVLSCMDTALRDDGELFFKYIKRKMEYNKGYPAFRREEFVYYYEHELLWATERVRNDKDIVFKIVSIEGRAYEDIGENLKNDYDIALMASTKGAPLRLIAPQFRNDKKIIKNCLKHTTSIDYILDSSDSKEIELILNLMAISDELVEDNKFMASVIKALPQVYNYLPHEMKMTCEYVLALSDTPNFIDLIPREFFQDPKTALAIIKADPETINYCTDLMKKPDFVKELISAGVDVSKNLPLVLKLNKEFMLDAIKMDSRIKSALPERLANDIDFKNL